MPTLTTTDLTINFNSTKEQIVERLLEQKLISISEAVTLLKTTEIIRETNNDFKPVLPFPVLPDPINPYLWPPQSPITFWYSTVTKLEQ